MMRRWLSWLVGAPRFVWHSMTRVWINGRQATPEEEAAFRRRLDRLFNRMNDAFDEFNAEGKDRK
jgi:hypothetical protein